MSLDVLGSPADRILQSLRSAIEEKLPGARVEVAATSPGHFEIRAVSALFEGKSMLKQQQLVYSAIAHLMQGHDAPVHAVDRLQTSVA
jgi:acid stress-induced BolA-like protein IbaG/YrbA